MSVNKDGRLFTPVAPVMWWLTEKIDTHKRKKRSKAGADAIDNLERLYRLKERGAITDSDFEELKEKLKGQI